MTESAPQHVPVAIGGHSRGGVLGRVAAVRAPDLVERLITVCTPWALGPPDRPGVAAVTKAIKGARRHGLDVLGSVDCADGPCCAVFRQQMSVRPRCPWTAIRSTADGIAGDQARVEGPDREIVTSTTHLGAILSVAGWQAIAEALR
jgi:pimeloyl-ACP methyl ester carboxylesterase